MERNPNLDLPLTTVMRPEIALSLQQVLNIYTVGSLLAAWRSPRQQRSIEDLFDSPQQARHAVAICASWLGVPTTLHASLVPTWWLPTDDRGAGAQQS